MKIFNYYYYGFLSLFGLLHFPVVLAEPTQILLSEEVFLHNIWQIMHKVISLTGTTFLFSFHLFFGWEYDTKQAEASSASDEAEIMLGT